MKISHPAATTVSQKLEALFKKGITGHGVFRLQPQPAGGGHARVEFQGPKLSAKPFFLKGKVGSSDYAPQLAVYRTEKALKFRGAIFAALANQTFDARTVETLATKLAKQGPKGGDLNQMNWRMGEELLKGSLDGKTSPDVYKKWATQAADNLVKLLHSEAGKALSPAARDVLDRLEFGIATSEGAQGLAAPGKWAKLIKEESGLENKISDVDRGIAKMTRDIYLATKARLKAIHEVEKPPLVAAAARFDARSLLAIPSGTTTATSTATTTNTTTTTTTTGGITLTASPQVDLERELRLLKEQRSASENVLSEYSRDTGAFSLDQFEAAQINLRLLDVAIADALETLDASKTGITNTTTTTNTAVSAGAQSDGDQLDAELQQLGNKRAALVAERQEQNSNARVPKQQVTATRKALKEVEQDIRALLALKAQTQQDEPKAVTTNTTDTSTSKRS